MMERKDLEAYLARELEGIRARLFHELSQLGHLNIVVDYDYISCFSSSHCDDKEYQVSFSYFYKANGERKF